MELTDELKAKIDGMSYYAMLSKWRFSKVGAPLFEGASGEYFSMVLQRKKAADPGAAVQASKDLGW